MKIMCWWLKDDGMMLTERCGLMLKYGYFTIQYYKESWKMKKKPQKNGDNSRDIIAFLR